VSKSKIIFFGLMLAGVLVLGACSNAAQTKTTAGQPAGETKGIETIALSGDIVSEKNGCVLQSRFAPGDKMIFRMNAIDPNTNQQAKNAKLQLHLSTGELLDMKIDHHPSTDKSAPEFWTAAYKVTNDTPAGTLNYYVTAEDGQKKGEFKPFNISLSLPTVIKVQATK
jgi:hypothetical protein